MDLILFTKLSAESVTVAISAVSILYESGQFLPRNEFVAVE